MAAKPKQDDTAQSKRFIELAKATDAVGSKGALDQAVKKVATTKRKPLAKKNRAR
jgi:hypothetical protein